MNAFNRDIEPNKTVVLQQLTALFPPEFVHPYPDALVEIAYGMPGNLDKAELFSAFKLDAAADFAVAKNRRGCNVYVGPTLKKGDTAPFARTNDDDFLAGLWAWTDHDAEGDFDRAKGKAKELSLAPGMIVDTGTVPHLRAHAYFKMSCAVTDAEQLRAVNKALQSSLGGDPVQAPSHVMRLAGTINYPTPKKAARGYVVEPVKVRVHRTPPPNRAETILGLSPNGAGASDSRRKGSLGFVLPRSDGELLELLAESRKPSKWHFSMRDAIATMIGRGWSDLQIRGMCAPYCFGGIADADLAPLIEGGRKKFDKPNPEDKPESGTQDDLPGSSRPPKPLAATLWVWRDPKMIQPREFLYGKHYIRKFVSVGFGAPGGGKSSKRLIEALAMASGRALLGVKPVRKLRVWYWNGEDPSEETDRRLAAACLHYGIKSEE
jgi:hypothetical protein